MSYQITLPDKTFLGKDALFSAKESLKKLGNHALIVTDVIMSDSLAFKDLERVLTESNINFSLYISPAGEPTDEMVSTGVEVFIRETCDFVIGVGGGSPIDIAKAISVMSQQQKSALSEYMGIEITIKTCPIVAIPTTAGTGSEATKFTVITEKSTDIKMLLKGEVLTPSLAIIDYTYTMTCPKRVTAATGLDALTHAVESYTSRKANPLTDVFAISAIKRIFNNLVMLMEDGNNALAREEMSIAAYEAGICINNASVTIVHGMSRPIGALFHVPHGLSNAILMGDCLEYVAGGNLERFAKLGRLICASEFNGDDFAASQAFIKALKKIAEDCQVGTLKDFGIDKISYQEMIPKMAKDALASGSPQNCWKIVSEKEIEQLYYSIWS